MRRSDSSITLTIDPWTASSLLQKAIRRGRRELARHAARELYRMRGRGIWRRLINVAIEDIGIADIDLVNEVVALATNGRLRDVLGGDAEVLQCLVGKLADAPKDRSTDYLYCAARVNGLAELRSQMSTDPTELLALTPVEESAMTRCAQLVLLACTAEGAGDQIAKDQPSAAFTSWLKSVSPAPLEATLMSLCKLRAHPFVLMLPLLWKQLGNDDRAAIATDASMPSAEEVSGIPLYTFDKHTAVGKQAIAAFVAQNSGVRAALNGCVIQACQIGVAAMAAFYADAIPISRRLDWRCSAPLQRMGFEADMAGAGCPNHAADAVLEAVIGNLDHLNDLRRSLALKSFRAKSAARL